MSDEPGDHDPELELVESCRLIAELWRRYDTLVFIAHKEHTDEADEWCGRVKPDIITAVGTMEAFKHKLLAELNEELEGEFD